MKFLPLTAIALLALGCSSDDDANNKSTSSSAATEAASKTSPSPVRLYVMDCGRVNIGDLEIFSNKGEYAERQHTATAMCYLVRHPQGDLIWDAGLPDALNAMPDGLTNGPFNFSVPTTMASQLEAVGVTPDDIEYFTVSHSHFDHIGNAALFAETSTFLVDKDERAYMFRDEARADAQSFPLVAALESAETTEFDGDYDVFGDGSVTIIATPGHTPGHTSLLVNLAKEGPVLITGDLYHLIESRERRIVPSFNVDADETLQSMDKFETLAKELGARVIVEHSVEHMNDLPLAPNYLE